VDYISHKSLLTVASRLLAVVTCIEEWPYTYYTGGTINAFVSITDIYIASQFASFYAYVTITMSISFSIPLYFPVEVSVGGAFPVSAAVTGALLRILCASIGATMMTSNSVVSISKIVRNHNF